jgi:hypothetical protein
MRRNRCAWADNLALRLRFESQAQQAYPHLRRQFHGQRQMARVIYRVQVQVPEYEPRRIELQFRRASPQPQITRIYADGPTDSPHRFRAHAKDPLCRSSLCVWCNDDPPEKRWIFEDGLLELIDLTRIHLFKEAYWRETGEWLGPEAPHVVTIGGKSC